MPARERSRITVVLDSPDEDWRAMDLVGEMLLAEWRSGRFEVDARPLRLGIPRLVRLAWRRDARLARNIDRAVVRYLAYPAAALGARLSAGGDATFFHVVDHSYAQVVHVLPGARTGVYCHDIDAFRPAFDTRHRAHPLNALARVLRAGLRSAAVVFHSTREVARELLERDLVDPSRLVHAPYGLAPEFLASAVGSPEVEAVLAPLGGRRYVLHVGSEIARKRLDVLFEVFARLLARDPELRLVQQGAVLNAAQRRHVERLGIAHALLQPPKLDRAVLAGLYRCASVVLVPSEAEGFGFPVLEALACGARIIASDIPVLREVGAEHVEYAAVGDVTAWTAIGQTILERPLEPPRDSALAHVRAFTWKRHAQVILEAYRNLPVTPRS